MWGIIALMTGCEGFSPDDCLGHSSRLSQDTSTCRKILSTFFRCWRCLEATYALIYDPCSTTWSIPSRYIQWLHAYLITWWHLTPSMAWLYHVTDSKCEDSGRKMKKITKYQEYRHFRDVRCQVIRLFPFWSCLEHSHIVGNWLWYL